MIEHETGDLVVEGRAGFLEPNLPQGEGGEALGGIEQGDRYRVSVAPDHGLRGAVGQDLDLVPVLIHFQEIGIGVVQRGSEAKGFAAGADHIMPAARTSPRGSEGVWLGIGRSRARQRLLSTG